MIHTNGVPTAGGSHGRRVMPWLDTGCRTQEKMLGAAGSIVAAERRLQFGICNFEYYPVGIIEFQHREGRRNEPAGQI